MATGSGSRIDYDPIADSYGGWYETPTGALYDRIEKQAVGEFMPSGSLSRLARSMLRCAG